MESAAKQQLLRYGQERKSARAVTRAPEPRESDAQDLAAAARAGARAPPTAADYAKFGQLLGSGKGARGPVRAVSDEVLTQGAPLPLPLRGLAELDGVPSAFGSLEALAGEAKLLVLLASLDTIMGERWRSTLAAFHGQADFSKLEAQVAAVSRVSCPTYRKLSRKAGVSYPLLSDPDGAWLGPLRATPDAPVAFIVEPRDAKARAVPPPLLCPPSPHTHLHQLALCPRP